MGSDGFYIGPVEKPRGLNAIAALLMEMSHHFFPNPKRFFLVVVL